MRRASGGRSRGAALVLALVLALPAAVSACSCAPAHPQQLLCDAALGECRAGDPPRETGMEGALSCSLPGERRARSCSAGRVCGYKVMGLLGWGVALNF